MTQQGYFVMDSMERTHKYGVTVYQVWLKGDAGIERTHDHRDGWNCLLCLDTLMYETSSKAKANAVCEYLNLKAEQDYVDQYRTHDTGKGEFIPHSIKIS
jgi:hypothetical protein